MADGGTCMMSSKGPVIVAGLMAIPEAMRAEEVPPFWSGDVSTDDVDARRVERRDPVPAQGSRMSDALPVLSDSDGAMFRALQVENHGRAEYSVARTEPCTRRPNPAWPVEVPDGA
jgi:hypothetical protein